MSQVLTLNDTYNVLAIAAYVKHPFTTQEQVTRLLNLAKYFVPIWLETVNKDKEMSLLYAAARLANEFGEYLLTDVQTSERTCEAGDILWYAYLCALLAKAKFLPKFKVVVNQVFYASDTFNSLLSKANQKVVKNCYAEIGFLNEYLEFQLHGACNLVANNINYVGDLVYKWCTFDLLATKEYVTKLSIRKI